jgi:hypothetical protein
LWRLILLVAILPFARLAVRAEGEGSAPTRAVANPADIEFFEKSVRPILAERCQGCHGTAKQKGGLRLDSRAAVIAGGSTGPAVIPGKPEESLLVDAINYGDTYQMPPKSKLLSEEIATLTAWVKRGAPWGVEPDTGAAKAAPGGKSDTIASSEFARRARHWSFQPIKRVPPPPADPRRPYWARNPIDRFIGATLAKMGLTPAPEAARPVLIRRLSFDLTGLPPTPEEVAAFMADSAPDAYERLVDRMLSSPRYGERWARHWLDLVRYAETAGHEFDYDIVNAFRYRDYVVCALNSDLPYDRFVVEQVAGDLLESPRRRPDSGANESIVGTGLYFLGEGTHSPVDVREEQMRRIDNQIDVVSKAFLGLTVACARCHDHKFDPITTKDYYALAGFLRSSRHQQAFLDDPRRDDPVNADLGTAMKAITCILNDVIPKDDSERMARRKPAGSEHGPGEAVFEDFNRDSFDGWFVGGSAFGLRPTKQGDFRVELSVGTGHAVAVSPGQAHSGLVSNKLRGVLRSRSFTIESRFIHWLASGRGGRINVVVDGFEKIRDPIYGELTRRVEHGDQPRWITQDLGMWVGHSAYLEISDGGTVDFDGANARPDVGSGFIAIDEIRMSNQRTQPATRESECCVLDLGALIAGLRRDGHTRKASDLVAAIANARASEAKLAEPAMALAITDGTGEDEHVHIRGSHKNLGDRVPRRFLAVLGGSDATTASEGSGRLELAKRMIDPRANPLLPRVLVNRLWKHHFGEGIVRTPDDFGAMGQAPFHPELLDWLADTFVNSGWSLKSMHRMMVTSSTYRMTSNPQGDAERADPNNIAWHRMNMRRLEAEAIRDALLAVSGRLDSAMFGPSVPVHLTSFMEGRGRPGHSGPLDGAGRRSLYLNVRRNFLDPMFLAFDMPVPFSTMGRRNVSNVPAQALTLLNDPLILEQSRQWAERILASSARSNRERLDALYLAAFARAPTQSESDACLSFLDERTAAQASKTAGAQASATAAWTDLAHVIVNMKQFIFVE